METTTYKIAGIDVHKNMLAVVVADVAGEGEFYFERRKFGTGQNELNALLRHEARKSRCNDRRDGDHGRRSHDRPQPRERGRQKTPHTRPSDIHRSSSR